MNKNFDEWNKIKKRIEHNFSKIKKFPQEGEIWMSSFGLNIGFEQDGIGKDFSRPVLILKRFHNKMFWVLPLSTKQKKLDFYFNFTYPFNKNVSIIVAQIKLMSIKRIQRKIYTLDKDIFIKVKNITKSFL